MVFESIKDSDVKVQLYGDSAVLTGRTDIKGKEKSQDISGAYRWLRVYVKRDGRWQVVAEQVTRMARP